ncbi:ABC transporter substrate-binding protein [Paenibacillus sediminis]|uniref:ABC-type nitrate/sulfonate/bicarbonate transport system substrate-binding protein n=1 Tax=Paenibacillus sediminis TaxID=664909 RepID=A0ABS4H338_9BACL|nr:ABC transporter substrate-binding protein [Paenibacillus sediminis]MBP1936945.1 ABC-type nitrate/sulfonate/bicarbonate transport system substrate-binding protein [Paenibacillus sediminis]
MRNAKWFIMLIVCMLVIVTGCSSTPKADNNSSSSQATGSNKQAAKTLKDVKVVLDWTPNTNHTGLYVAKDQGYYKEEGLNVEIVQPGSGGADAMVASGEAQFGISYQESVTQGRTQGVPLVSIAAIIQHNTSGFAAPADRGIKSPKDFEGKKYGGWGSPVEEAMLKTLVEENGGDYSKVKYINMGDADYFTAVKRDIDFAWIYYAWTGIEAEQRNQPLNMLYVKDYDKALDYYTPILVTSEKVIAQDPELVKAFMRATSKGYQYAIQNPEKAADILIKAVPDLNAELVKASQKWLSPRYQDDAARWGEQKKEVWQNFSDWLYKRKLLDKPLDVDKAFTNDYLPAGK